jgi:hypothetical protein
MRRFLPMRRSTLFVLVLVGICLALGLGVSSAQRLVNASGGGRPGAIRGAASTGQVIGIGPGFGGVGRFSEPARFIGLTTQKFPVGVGALAASQACNTEHPVSRLCERAEIFRALPPVTLESEVLVATNYETNPVTGCLNPMGGVNCRPFGQRLPAACCGFPVPTAGPLASLTLSPADDQSVVNCSNTFTFTATALDTQGLPLEGITVIIDIPPVVGGTELLMGDFNPAYGITDANGMVSSTLTLTASICAANCTGGLDCSARVRARDLSGLVFSNEVTLVDQIP